jgi:ribosomal protein S18 acetylase RimI-like enzyme
MTIQIISIDKDVLSQMQKILSSSAGYDVSIQDELDYFNPAQSGTWFLATDQNGEQLGFIRCFEINSEWSLGEFFITSFSEKRVEVGEKLLQYFSSKSSFPNGHRLRFDISINDHVLNNLIIEKGLSHKKQIFKYFEIPTVGFSDKDFKSASIDNVNVNQVAEVLSNLAPVELGELSSWLSNNQVRTITVDGKVIVAAQISNADESVEIVRIATHPDFLRQGHAEKLINDICQESFQKGKSKIYLKVDSVKIPAIHLYKKVGFKEVEEKTQYWHSSWF